MNNYLQGFTVTDIAAWQIAGLGTSRSNRIRVSLPSLQRGAVWKPRQIEALWDSMIRGFPVGAFLLTPFNQNRGDHPLNFDQSSKENTDDSGGFHLLDGQQRSNAIALGFLNPWQGPISDNLSPAMNSAVLWVDLAPTGKRNEDRLFAFRVVTQSHPWGYSLVDPSERLEAKIRRTALLKYQQCIPPGVEYSIQPGMADLRFVWPWDAQFPVPVSFLIQLIKENETDLDRFIEGIKDICELKLPFFKDQVFNDTFAKLDHPPEDFKNRLAILFSGFKTLLTCDESNSYQIPAQFLPTEIASVEVDTVDPVETLFIRINAAGTKLDGEELNYSILKSIWPDARNLVESLESRLMSPARLVTLFSRLAMASDHIDDAPPLPDVSRFRNLVHKRDPKHLDFLDKLKGYLGSKRAGELLSLAKSLLEAPGTSTNPIGLPVVIIADIARKTPDVFFLLMRWLDMMPRSSLFKLNSDSQRKHLAGAITTLAWFSVDSNLCLKALWPILNGTKKSELPGFWSRRGLLLPTLFRVANVVPLIPPLPSKIFQKGVNKRLYGLLKNGTGETWKNWEWNTKFSVGHVNKKKDEIFNHYITLMNRAQRTSDSGAKRKFAEEAWLLFSEQTWSMFPLVLYSQREWLATWFPRFDPAQPNQLEDTDRPWDVDHIHAQNYIKNSANAEPAFRLIKDNWHGSIGNLRAWPLELNRADGDSCPRVKLNISENEDEINRHKKYHLHRTEDILRASVVPKNSQNFWNESTPPGSFKTNYLKTAGSCHPNLLNAIVNRWVHLYSNWYSDFDISNLFSQPILVPVKRVG